MKLYHVHLEELIVIAVQAALEAGDYICGQRSVHHNQIHKKVGNTEASQIVTDIDYKSQEIILSHLQTTCIPFDIGLLAEEDIADSIAHDLHEGSRFSKDYFWCVDPLDGTLPFVEGIPGYAISIALVSKEGIPVIGVVYDPKNNVLYQAIKGLNCLKNGSKWELKTTSGDGVKADSEFLFSSNRSFQKLPSYAPMKKDIDELANTLGHGQVVEQQKGGAVMNAIWTLEKAPGCYVALPKMEDGGGSIWDFAATACIFEALGIPPTNCFGKPLTLNDKDTTFMNKHGVVYASGTDIKKGLLKEIDKYLS